MLLVISVLVAVASFYAALRFLGWRWSRKWRPVKPFVFVAILVGPAALTTYLTQELVIEPDGPFTGVPCEGGVWASSVKLGPKGFAPAGCALTYGRITFENAGEETPYGICVGHDGRCSSSGRIPAVLHHGLALAPGEARSVELPIHRTWQQEFDRAYPLTFTGDHRPGPDFVVQVKVTPELPAPKYGYP
ncbi:hypothetical protein [Actinocorallia lasiicapitis]